MWVRSWIRSQSDVGVARELGRVQQAGRVGRQVEAQDLGGGAADAAEALGLAVAEDRAEVVLGRALGGREGLREEDRALGVVARGVVDEGRPGRTSRCRSGCARALTTHSRPRDADDQRLEAGVARGVLLVHREDDQVLDAVAAVALGPERLHRAGEVRLRRTRPRPTRRGRRASASMYVGLVGEAMAERLGPGGDVGRPARAWSRGRGPRAVDRAVGRLQGAELLDRVRAAGSRTGRRRRPSVGCGVPALEGWGGRPSRRD